MPSKRPGYQSEYTLNRYHNDPIYREKAKRYSREGNERRKAKCRQMLAEFCQGGCVVCGERNPACLDAHHVDPATKNFEIGRGWGRMSPRKFRQELAKCVCLCANHHRLVEAGEISLVDYGIKQLPPKPKKQIGLFEVTT